MVVLTKREKTNVTDADVWCRLMQSTARAVMIKKKREN
jgi:hypothetical protein